MATHSVGALVDDVLATVPSHEADKLRDEALGLALNLLLEPAEITALLAELESRTGKKLDRRIQSRAGHPASRRFEGL